MKKLRLNEMEKSILKEYGSVVIIRNGYEIIVEYNKTTNYINIDIVNPYDKIEYEEDILQELKNIKSL